MFWQLTVNAEDPERLAQFWRLHLDLYPTGRDNSLAQSRRVELVDARVATLVELGAVVQRSERADDPADPVYFVVLRDPEGNEFCVS